MRRAFVELALPRCCVRNPKDSSLSRPETACYPSPNEPHERGVANDACDAAEKQARISHRNGIPALCRAPARSRLPARRATTGQEKQKGHVGTQQQHSGYPTTRRTTDRL